LKLEETHDDIGAGGDFETASIPWASATTRTRVGSTTLILLRRRGEEEEEDEEGRVVVVDFPFFGWRGARGVRATDGGNGIATPPARSTRCLTTTCRWSTPYPRKENRRRR
jgi:hypothetical protein